MEPLKTYNTLACEKQTFAPIEPGRVCMYVYRMMVYDCCYVGYARIMVVFNMVQRQLRVVGHNVTYVRNITDIDSKIIKRAAENDEMVSALTGRFIAIIHENADVLGVQYPDHELRATEYVPQIPSMIGRLQTNDLAYQMTGGDMNYAVHKSPGYGKLFGKSPENLRTGERMVANDAKQNSLDFMLWKSAKAEEPAEPRRASLWGERHPGWYIECSAMSCELLGGHFDLYDGGVGLQFPHHENEIVQSKGATDETLINTWVHNSLVRVNDKGMSEPFGNFFTVRGVPKLYDAGVVRFFIFHSHYRDDLDYGDAHLDDAYHALTRLYMMLKDVPATVGTKSGWNESYDKRFLGAMNDDFNAPVTVSVLFGLASEVNKMCSSALASQLTALVRMLDLLNCGPHAFLQGSVSPDGSDAVEVEARIEECRAAETAHDFARADAIRADLLTTGIALEDKPGGVIEQRHT